MVLIQSMLWEFGLSFGACAALTPLMIFIARRMDWVVEPRSDRWHQKPTAVFGGVGIFLAFCAAFLLTGPHPATHWVLAACAGGMFLVGLIDDAREMRPQMKLVAQILLALAAVSLGVRLDQEVIPWPWLSIPLAVIWMVGVTNAVNILDNMDGLSSGTVLIAGLVLAIGSVLNAFTAVAPLAAMLAGAAGGFLIYNFNPAKIFMGDCGSMFLGFTLAGISILAANTAAGASHLAMPLLVPLGALVVPIFDTTLVSFQRTQHGRSIAQGGRDHSSHRLVFLGFSERKAVTLLLLVSAAGGAFALALTSLASPLISAVVVALFFVGLIFFGVYLGEVKVYESGPRRWKSPVLDKLILHKKQMLQILVDLTLLSAAYAAAWLLRFEGGLDRYYLGLLTESLPILLGVKMTCFWFFGLYRGEWRYLSVYDLVQILKACLTGTVLTVAVLAALFRFEHYSRAVMIIDFVLSYIFIAGARSLIRVFREKIRQHRGVPVLIVGAGDGGEMLLREIRNNSSLDYMAVGFVDDDPAKLGSAIHGVKVLGKSADLERLITTLQVEHVFISILSARGQTFDDIFALCRRLEVPCDRIQPLIKLP